MCELLKQPHFIIIQNYFDNEVVEIDDYNDIHYFYNFFGGLNEEEQDTVYNHLRRLYDYTKMKSKQSQGTVLTKFIEDIEGINKAEDLQLVLDSSVQAIANLNDIAVIGNKMSVINQLLSTADSYIRVSGAVVRKDCDERCGNSEKRHENLRKERLKKERLILIWSVLTSMVISIIITIVLLWIFGGVGSKQFVNFLNDNLIGVIVGGLTTLCGTIFMTYLKILKKTSTP